VGKPNIRNAGLSFFNSNGRIALNITNGGGDLHRKAVSKSYHKSGVSYFRTAVISFLQR